MISLKIRTHYIYLHMKYYIQTRKKYIREAGKKVNSVAEVKYFIKIQQDMKDTIKMIIESLEDIFIQREIFMKVISKDIKDQITEYIYILKLVNVRFLRVILKMINGKVQDKLLLKMEVNILDIFIKIPIRNMEQKLLKMDKRFFHNMKII